MVSGVNTTASIGSKFAGEKRRSADQSYLSLDQEVGERLHLFSCGIVHAYEDGAACSFVRAKELGIHCSYELPIAHWATSRRLLAEEAERFPQWEPTLESTREPEAKLARKEEELDSGRLHYLSERLRIAIHSFRDPGKTPCQVAPFGSLRSCPISLAKVQAERRTNSSCCSSDQ